MFYGRGIAFTFLKEVKDLSLFVEWAFPDVDGSRLLA